MNQKFIFGILGILILAGGIYYFSRPVDIPGTDLTFQTVQKDFHGGVETPKNVAVVTQAEWTTIWNQMAANITPKPPVPEVDFDTEMVIGTFMGVKGSGGFSTEITDIKETDTNIIVSITEVSPGQYCAVTLALTNPYHIVKTTKSSKQVEFSVTKNVTECPAP